jgi:hypothetical protein
MLHRLSGTSRCLCTPTEESPGSAGVTLAPVEKNEDSPMTALFFYKCFFFYFL